MVYFSIGTRGPVNRPHSVTLVFGAPAAMEKGHLAGDGWMTVANATPQEMTERVAKGELVREWLQQQQQGTFSDSHNEVIASQ